MENKKWASCGEEAQPNDGLCKECSDKFELLVDVYDCREKGDLTMTHELKFDHENFNSLLPCPFCGGKVKIMAFFQNGEDCWKTSHPGCEAEVLFYGSDLESKQAVIETWNKRA